MTGTTMTGAPEVSFDETIPSSFVLDKQMRVDLREPFPPEQIGQVNKGFGTVDFIGHAAITDRLNRAAPGWTYRVEPVVIQGKDGLPHVMAVFGTMTVGGVTRQEVGDVEHMTRYGDELKKAISDFICRGAMRFGVGLDLWSKEQLESPSRETPAGVQSSLSAAGERSPLRGESAPIRGTGSSGADAGARIETTSSGSRASSAPRQAVSGAGPTAGDGGTGSPEETSRPGNRVGADSSSEGTTAARDAGTRGTTADPSDSSAPAAGPPHEKPKGRGDGVATKGEDERSRPLPSSSPAGAKRKKKYPLDPRNCLHAVGIDLDGRCEDCGEQMEVSA